MRQPRNDGVSLDRLVAARAAMGLTRDEVAEMVGVASNTIYCWETEGRYDPSFLTVMGLSLVYDRPVEWFYPRGLPFSLPAAGSSESSATTRSQVALLHAVLDAGVSFLGVSLDDLLGVGSPLVSRTPSSLELLDPDVLPVEAAAGAGAEVPDGSGVVRLDRCDLIVVTGDSMEPTLPDGGSILVDRDSAELLEGRVFVLRTEEGLVVKRVRRGGDGWLLCSDNPSWEPVPLGPEDSVVGQVLWAGRPL